MAKISYITLDQLMASVESDISAFADARMVNRGQLIKVVRKVNEDLGLRINREKETLVDIQNYKGDLPEDFQFLQLALACGPVQLYHVKPDIPGTHFEHRTGKPTVLNAEVPVQHFSSGSNVCMNSEGGCYWVAQKFQDRVVKYTDFTPLRLTRRSQKFCADTCVNSRLNSAAYDLDIDNGEMTVGFREGKIYMNYLTDMIDDDGNVLILDHPLTTEYYEYAVKKHILENIMLNNQADVAQKLMYIKNELRDARIRAHNFVGTIEYSQIQETFAANRRRFWNKYNSIFDAT